MLRVFYEIHSLLLKILKLFLTVVSRYRVLWKAFSVKLTEGHAPSLSSFTFPRPPPPASGEFQQEQDLRPVPPTPPVAVVSAMGFLPDPTPRSRR